MKPDRNPVAAHQRPLAPVLGLGVSEGVARGVRNHPEPSRIRISNYFCLGTYDQMSATTYPINVHPRKKLSTVIGMDRKNRSLHRHPGRAPQHPRWRPPRAGGASPCTAPEAETEPLRTRLSTTGGSGGHDPGGAQNRTVSRARCRDHSHKVNPRLVIEGILATSWTRCSVLS
jgi:hypothetical protein